MAVQMSSPALRAENVATPSPNACNRPKTTKATTSANCNDGTKQTDLRNQTARKPPQRTISHPMVTLGGWSNDASQCITPVLCIGNGPACNTMGWRPACNTMGWRLQPNLHPSEPESLLRVNNSSRERMQLSKQPRPTNTGDWTPSDMKFIK